MTGFVLRRLAASLLLLLIVLSLTFALLHALPGDPARLLEDPRGSAEQRAHLRAAWGLDKPLPEQYLRWLAAVVRGDWGASFVHQRGAAGVLLEALPNTLLLAVAALPLQFGLGLWLGIAAARRRGQAGDHLIRVASLVLYSLPVFWLGTMAVLAFAVGWPILPASHMHEVGADAWPAPARALDLLRHLVLPATVLAVTAAGGLARFVRGGLLEVLGQEFVRAARARGLGERRVLWGHALRNAAGPLLQLFGLQLPILLGGSLVVEVVFAWPGVGRLGYDALLARDYPLILASTALFAGLVLLGGLLADILHAVADPRLRDA